MVHITSSAQRRQEAPHERVETVAIRSQTVRMCTWAAMQAVEELRNKVSPCAETDSPMTSQDHPPPARQSHNNEILFGINSAPPWYLVIAYTLQVRVTLFWVCIQVHMHNEYPSDG